MVGQAQQKACTEDRVIGRYKHHLIAGVVVAGVLFLSAFALRAHWTPPRADGPNIVLILVDDLGFEGLSINGSASYSTPNIDRLARDGIRFRHCYSQPMCTPSRVKLLTGQYNFLNYTEFSHLDPSCKTVGNLLQDAGYKTCAVGKWQLNGVRLRLPYSRDSGRPADAGFDQSFLWNVTQSLQKSGGCWFPVFEKNGQVLKRMANKYGPDLCADFVCDFMSANRDRPFFVYYPMVLVHRPFRPTPDSPDSHREIRGDDPKYYKDMVQYVDKLVGRIDAHLDRLGIRDDTLLILVGDNGAARDIETLMSDGRVVRGGKGMMKDSGTHAPMVLSWPGKVRQGRVSDELIDFSDFYPTFAELADVRIPADESDGVSFVPVMTNSGGRDKPHIFSHFEPRFGLFDLYRGRTVRNQRYKLYHDGRLFDVQRDPDEDFPIPPDDPSTRGIREHFQGVLDSMPAFEPRPLKRS